MYPFHNTNGYTLPEENNIFGAMVSDKEAQVGARGGLIEAYLLATKLLSY